MMIKTHFKNYRPLCSKPVKVKVMTYALITRAMEAGLSS